MVDLNTNGTVKEKKNIDYVLHHKINVKKANPKLIS